MSNNTITEELKSGTGRAVLVAVATTDKADECNRSLDELARLLETAGGEEVARVIQNRETPDKATYIGSGKAEEVALDAQALEADLIIVDECQFFPVEQIDQLRLYSDPTCKIRSLSGSIPTSSSAERLPSCTWEKMNLLFRTRTVL
mgnify:CR=1 FL=1